MPEPLTAEERARLREELTALAHEHYQPEAGVSTRVGTLLLVRKQAEKDRRAEADRVWNAQVAERAKVPPEQFRAVIDAAPDTKTLNETMQARHPHMTFTLEGLDLEAAKAAVREFDRLGAQWPEVLREHRTFGNAQPSKPFKDDRWYAFASFGKGIGLNPQRFNDMDRLRRSLEADTASGWSPKKCDTIESVIAHEFGHNVKFWLEGSAGEGGPAFLSALGVDGIGAGRDTLAAIDKHSRRSRKLSVYSLTDDHESFAEAFAALEMQGPEARKIAPIVDRYAALLDLVREARAEGRLGTVNDTPFASDLSGEERERRLQELAAVRKRLGIP